MVPEKIATSPKRGMAFNVRWDLSVVKDPAYRSAFGQAYDLIDSVDGLDSAPLPAGMAPLPGRRQRQPHAADRREDDERLHARMWLARDLA